MYEIDGRDLVLVHDAHPQYASTAHALELLAAETRAVQHHRAHVASVLAERAAWDERVIGVSFDGTGYGDDGTIWAARSSQAPRAKGLSVWRICALRLCPVAMRPPRIRYKRRQAFWSSSTNCPI